MPKVITFALQKGGTGKTSMGLSVAVELAQKGHRVLILDADPQGNTTSWILNRDIEHELSDVLFKKCTAKDAILSTDIENLSITPTASLSWDLGLYAKTAAVDNPNAIKQLIRSVKDEFDYVIIDTSPAFGALEVSCFLASDEAIAVLRIDEFSSDGIITFLANIHKMQEQRETDLPIINKVILNSRDLRLAQQNNDVDKITSSIDAQIFIMPVDPAFAKSQSVHVPVQFLTGTKKETLSVLSAIADSLV